MPEADLTGIKHKTVHRAQAPYKIEQINSAVKGTLWNRIGLGLKFIYPISLTIEYIMDPHWKCIISYHHAFPHSSHRQVGSTMCASGRARETMR